MFNHFPAALSGLGTAVILGLIFGFALGCGTSSQSSVTLTVFAAASLTDPFQEIATQFESNNPGVTVRLNFAGSQRLRSQLELGAKADIFASADEMQMDLARDAGLISGDVQRFTSTKMAVIAYSESDVSDVADLGSPGTTVVLPHGNVPAGIYGRQLLRRLSSQVPGLGEDFADRVLANVVSEETSVKYVEQKVVLGQADAGIVYHPGAKTATASGKVIDIPLPPLEEEVRAHYPIAAIEDSDAPELANEFLNFVLSGPAQEILAGYGFEAQ